jgi:hypothetical protein
MRNVGATAVIIFACALSFAQAPYVQEQRKTIIAIIENVDVLQKKITVLDTWGKATEFELKYNGAIYSSSYQMGTIDDLQPGSRVQITYSGTDAEPNNIIVIVLPIQREKILSY